jgi:hypothetical protein
VILEGSNNAAIGSPHPNSPSAPVPLPFLMVESPMMKSVGRRGGDAGLSSARALRSPVTLIATIQKAANVIRGVRFMG